VPKLRERSEKRVASNLKFQELKKLIARLKEMNKREKITLNEKKRWKMMEDEKKISDEQSAVLERSSGGDDKKKSKDEDIFIDEAVHIMLDILELAPEKSEVAASAKDLESS
jgi:hypothetical protein